MDGAIDGDEREVGREDGADAGPDEDEGELESVM